MTLSPALQQLLASLPADPDFSALIQALYTIRFTGPVTLDFLNGVPRQLNLGPPVRLTICAADPPAEPAAPQGLDRRKRVRTG